YRHSRELLEPVLCDHSGVITGSARHDGDAFDGRNVEIHLRQCDLLFHRAQVGAERLRDDGRLLENLLLHEVSVIALFDRRGRGTRCGDLTFYRVVVLVEDRGAFAGDNHPITLVEIGDLLRQRCKSERVGTEVGFIGAVPYDKRRTEPRADEYVGMRAKSDRKRERSAQLRQDLAHRILRRFPGFNLFGNKVGNDFGVGFALETTPPRKQRITQWLEIFDDAVVNQGNLGSGVRVGVVRGGCAVRRPASMRDADCARSGIALEFDPEVGQLALRTAADELPSLPGADSRAVVSTIFHPPEAIDEPVGDRLLADDADNSAHGWSIPG